jgi:hypothetical protein
MIFRLGVNGITFRLDVNGITFRLGVNGITFRLDVNGITFRFTLKHLRKLLDAANLLYHKKPFSLPHYLTI